MKVRVEYQGKTIAGNILIADDLGSRLVGLMFRKSPPQGSDGLLIDPCNSIHTCFMRYALDIVFLSKENKVVKIVRNIAPWRMTWIYFKARRTLELPAGKLPASVKEGDLLEVVNV
jgi:uncharacterized membrane protein (UPF0127 family)